MTLYELSTEIAFSNQRLAEIAYDVLRVDSEPKRSQVIKTLAVNENKLSINLKSQSLKNLRVGSTSLFDHLLLSVETMEVFGPAVSEEYSHYNA